MAIQTRLVEYQQGGTTLEGVFAWDDAAGEQKPVVLVAHAWSGKSDFEINKATMLAELGYTAFVLDTYGIGVRGTCLEENQALIAPFMADRQSLRDRLLAAVDVAKSQPEADANKVAAIGFCFGGLCVLDMARSGADIAGVVSFHGLFVPADIANSKPISAKILCLHGYDDPMATPEQMTALATELSQAGADWQIHAYGNTLHAFTNPNANDPDFGTVYSAQAEARSLRAMENFLAEIFC